MVASSYRFIVVVALSLLSVVAVSTAHAQVPVPTCTNSGAAEEFVGEQATFTVSIENTGTATGYRPGVDLFLPPGLSFSSASFADGSVNVDPVGTQVVTGGNVVHPLTGLTITGTSGQTYQFLPLPVTAQPGSMPTLTMTIVVDISPTATVGTALTATAVCGYFFGTDAVNDPATDVPPRLSSSLAITPILVTLSKSVIGAVCTGSNYEFDWIIDIDVATGKTLAAFAITDTLPSSFKITMVDPDAGTAGTLPAGPGGTLGITYPALAGAAGVDASITVSGYVVIGTVDLDDPDQVAVENSVEVHGSGGTGTNLTSGTISVPSLTETAQTSAGVFQIEESIVPTTLAPGQDATVTLDICISDDDDINSVTLTSVLNDGLTFDDNGMFDGNSIIETSEDGTGPTTLLWTLGGLADGTQHTLSYDVTVNQNYLAPDPDEPVLAGDVIKTTQTLDGTIASTMEPATVDEGGSIADDSATIAPLTFLKTTITPADGDVVAGEFVTYDLLATFSSGDIGTVVLKDFFPGPIFEAASSPIDPRSCTQTAQGDNDFTLDTTTTEGPSGDNFRQLTFDPISGATETKRLHYRFTCQVLNGPADDGFVFTNVATLAATNTQGTTTRLAFTALTKLAPELTIVKTAAPTTVDAGDTVMYTITVTNGGSADAFDTFIADAIPAGLTFVPGSIGISGGSFVGTDTDLFTGGGVEVSTIAAAPAGVVTITYEATVDATASTTEVLSSTATITNFESEEVAGAANHAIPAGAFTDDAAVTVAPLVPTNELADLGTTSYAIGDDFLYNATITIPEGEHDGVSFTYTLEEGLEFVQTENPDLSAVMCGDPGGPFGACSLPSPVVSADNRTVTWTFTDAISNPPAAGPEAISFDIRAAVSDDDGIRGQTPATTLSVSSNDAVSSDITVIEPALTIGDSFSGTGDGGDTITLNASLSHLGASDSDAHDVTWTYNFASTGLTPVAGAVDLTSCTEATSGVASGSTITLTFATLADGPPACSFAAPVTIDAGVTNGSTLTVPTSATYSSLSGGANFPGVSDERDYTANGSVSYTVMTSALVKTFVTTDRTETSVEPGIAIGEEAIYTLTVTVPDGTNPSTVVCDDPPPGLAITNVVFNTIGFVGTITPPIAPLSGTQGEQLCWNFGSVVATSGVGTVGNSFSITLTTEAEFVDGMASGPVNSTSLSIGGTTQNTDSVDVLFALPTLTVDLSASGVIPEAQDTVTMMATATNSADAPACDTSITATVPTGFTLVDLTTDGLNNDLDGATDEADEASLVVGSSIVFPINAATAGGNGCLDDTNPTLVFPYRLTADDGIPPTAVDATATLASYGSLPNNEGDTLSPANDDADNNGSASIDEAGDATDTVTFTPTAPVLTFEKVVSDDNGGSYEPNDIFTYTITLTNSGTGNAYAVVLTDVIPTTANAAFVPGSETISSGTIAETGGVLTSSSLAVANGSDVVVTFKMQFATPLPTGSSVSNQAGATVGRGYGPLVSDDPSTGAVDDPTVIATASTADPDGDGVCTAGAAVAGVCVAGPDVDPNDPNACADVDADLCDDCALVFPPDPANDGVDVEGDGDCNIGDVDADNDGIPDVSENSEGIDPYGDADNDSVFNYLDPDDQGDGNVSDCVNTDEDPTTCDAISSLFDTDGDSIPDHLDLDADNDGIPDVVEAGHGEDDSDMDGQVDGPYNPNGIANAVDSDADGDIEYAIRDTDGDGTPDFQDVDSDNDGDSDISESGNEAFDGDDDGRVDSPTDADNDGIHDDLDTDDGSFGDPEVNAPALIANFDADGDGIPDPYDFDDSDDPTNGGDSNSDGFDDAVQCPNPPGWQACPDDDNDGTPNYSEPRDTDGDGSPDEIDIDTDNDGIRDVDENLLGLDPYADNDSDGIPNYLDANDRGDGMTQTCTDGDSNDVCEVPGGDYDRDGDGIANHLDLDADNDGIPDVTEAGHGRDSGGSGVVVCPAGFGTNGYCDDVESTPESGTPNYPLLNTDGALIEGSDAVPDFLDLDSDADGLFDLAEVSALAGLDSNADGMIDDPTDVDEDGILGAADGNDSERGFPSSITDPRADDADLDRIPDPYDNDDEGGDAGDSDEDGVPDDVECNGTWLCQDIDSDGTPDYMEPADADDDGVPDVFDLDDDNDGILDVDETLLGLDGSADNDNDGIPNLLDADDRGDGTAAGCTDGDSNGACDQIIAAYDFDGDGIGNIFDLDSDGDGIFDADESSFGGTDSNRDGILDCPSGFGANGVCDDVETSPDSGMTAAPADTDEDLSPDFLDLDADGDNISDADEAGDDDVATVAVDSDGDGTEDYRDLDSDGDTIPDIVEEAGDGDISTPPVDTDEDGTPDYRDLDTDDDGLSDEDEAGEDPNDPVDTDGDGTADFRDVDSDDDGVDDGEDNCLLTANPDQTDQDRDGAGAACDDDDDGNGYDDDIGLQGGGCSAGGSTGLGFALMVAVLLLAVGRRRRRTLAAAAVALAALAVAGDARAQPVAVETEYTVERFRLSTDRQGILDVESANVPGHLSFDLGLWLGYADDPLNLYSRSDGDRERLGSLVSHRLAGTLVASLALWKRVQFGLAVPVILSQDQNPGDITMGPPSSISSFGLGDLRLAPKVQLLKHEDQWLDLAVVVGFTLPTGTSNDYFGDGQVMFQPELLVSKPITERLRTGINIGYRVRRRQDAFDLQVNDELYGHVGAAYKLTEDFEVDGTFSMATASGDVLGAFNRNFSELRGGVAYYLAGSVLFAAAGYGTSEGFGTPDWRALAGIRFGRLRDDKQPRPQPEPEPIAKPEDDDGDGIVDELDKCPSEPENINSWLDDDGCPDTIPDSDNDGIDDLKDACKDRAEDIDTFKDDDGCPDLDNDSDGVTDAVDVCPLVAGVVANEGCPDADKDGDSVVDRLDNCPDEAGDPANSGCKKKQLVKIIQGKLELLDRVHFRTNKAQIRARSYLLLRNVAQVLNNHPEIKTIHIEGHTDSRGSDSYNKGLSQRRAESVVKFLVKAGLDGARLTPIGYGEEKPIDDNNTVAGRAANRRVEFKLIGEASSEIKNQDSGPTEDTIDN